MTIAVDFERKQTNKQTNKQTKLQLNKTNSSDAEAPCFDLDLTIRNGIVSSQIYDKGGAFNFEMVNFPFLDGDVPCPPPFLWCVYFTDYSFCERVFQC